jgi:hypothetical protein
MSVCVFCGSPRCAEEGRGNEWVRWANCAGRCDNQRAAVEAAGVAAYALAGLARLLKMARRRPTPDEVAELVRMAREIDVQPLGECLACGARAYQVAYPAPPRRDH